jgi:hypothetical protein
VSSGLSSPVFHVYLARSLTSGLPRGPSPFGKFPFHCLKPLFCASLPQPAETYPSFLCTTTLCTSCGPIPYFYNSEDQRYFTVQNSDLRIDMRGIYYILCNHSEFGVASHNQRWMKNYTEVQIKVIYSFLLVQVRY